MEHRKSPCSACPFSRKGTPGELGGSDAAIYVGQVSGPFFLPCHQQYQDGKPTDDMSNPQCAGAAIFRSNIGVADRIPPILHHLPPDRDTVFANHAEFLAHHRGISLEAAEEELARTPPSELLAAEFARAGLSKVKLVPRT